jgi:hypothetical protein
LRHLEGYRGILQVDGYAAYTRLARLDRGNDAVTLAGGRSHVRHRFYELHISDSETVPESDWDAGLSGGKRRLYRPVMGAPSIVLRSDNLENAKTEAVEHWRSFPRDQNVEGYPRLNSTQRRPFWSPFSATC